MDDISELETENRMIRARNERLEGELKDARAEKERIQKVLERIISISSLALWGGRSEATVDMGPKEHQDKASY